MQLQSLPDAQISADLVEIEDAFRSWEQKGRLVIPGCLEATLGREVALTPRAWRAALVQRRDTLLWERKRRAAPGVA